MCPREHDLHLGIGVEDGGDVAVDVGGHLIREGGVAA